MSDAWGCSFTDDRDDVLDAQLRLAPLKELPADPIASLMRMDMPGWPDDTFVAVRGILAFGPGDDKLATECALHSLRLNRDCMLARQLLQLLSTDQDPRIPFSDHDTEVRVVLTKMAGDSLPDKTRKKPWWKFW